jgi:hypothetical protein
MTRKVPESRGPENSEPIDEAYAKRRLEEALQKYRFTVEELGPEWRRFVELPSATAKPQ